MASYHGEPHAVLLENWLDSAKNLPYNHSDILGRVEG